MPRYRAGSLQVLWSQGQRRCHHRRPEVQRSRACSLPRRAKCPRRRSADCARARLRASLRRPHAATALTHAHVTTPEDIGASLADNGGGGASLTESGVARTSRASCTGGGGSPALSRRSLVSLTAEGGTHDGPKLLGCTRDSRYGDSGRDDLCPGGGFASKNPVSDCSQGRRTHNSPYRAHSTRARSCAGRRMRPLLRRRIECGGREVSCACRGGRICGFIRVPGLIVHMLSARVLGSWEHIVVVALPKRECSRRTRGP
ncbi:hypothetical protein B0H11DRAFT_2280863 [Mycena galericulata]|nr:hypothetical protein B0H11DRAFT_2280863 [Mycena galericulata]